ncbi:hypothetical protein ACUNWD_10965 [Sunxiuqinia sp. A32]|uniref:hypothetical protein n=1 Tax=Sunxiuqinia sp. A32 TaxID=3461496 RepID=UPI0040458FE2
MKTKLLPLMMMVVAMLAATAVFAQPSSPQGTAATKTALDGSTETYSVNLVSATDGVQYVWALSGGSTTNTVGTRTYATGSLENPNEVSITWDDATAGQTYTLTVYVVDENACYSEMKSLEITIEKATIDIDASQVATTCAWLGGEGISGNTVASDEFVVDVTSDGGITPAAIQYQILDASDNVLDTRSASVTLLTGSFTVSLDGTFINTTTSDRVLTIKLLSATDSDSNSMDIGTTEATVTIHPISVITFN